MLDAISPLNGFNETINDVTMREATGFGLLALAMPLKGERRFTQAVKKIAGCTPPKPGGFTRSKDGKTMLIWSTPDQFFLLNNNPAPMQETALQQELGSNAYVTDQSDGWVILDVSGNRALEALERICPIDLDPNVFSVGSVARTMMEHLGVTIMRVEENTWRLMSPRSSSASFLHAVTQSAKNL